MSTKSDSSGKSLAVFSDGHVEKIMSFEFSKDDHDIWFTVESGRWFIHKEELVCNDGRYSPEYKFYEVKFDRHRDDESEDGEVHSVRFVETGEIEKIRLNLD